MKPIRVRSKNNSDKGRIVDFLALPLTTTGVNVAVAVVVWDAGDISTEVLVELEEVHVKGITETFKR